MAAIEEIRHGLAHDSVVDIVTLGRKSGELRKIEIWFHNIDGRIIICGKPRGKRENGAPWSNRGWLANMRANPAFTFCLKESCQAELEVRAVEICDEDDRRSIMSLPKMEWYHQQVESVEELVVGSPIVEVFFDNSEIG